MKRNHCTNEINSYLCTLERKDHEQIHNGKHEQNQIDSDMGSCTCRHCLCPDILRVRPALEGATVQSLPLLVAFLQAADGGGGRHAFLLRHLLHPVLLLSLVRRCAALRMVGAAAVADQAGLLHPGSVECRRADTHSRPADRQHVSGLLV